MIRKLFKTGKSMVISLSKKMLGALQLNEGSDEGEEMKFTRITIDPHQMGGVACIRGLRIPVATIVGALAEGMSEDEILGNYPDLEVADIREALRFAAEALQERELALVPA